MVTFGEATKMGFKRALDFKGRSSRSEYWWFFLAVVLIQVVGSLLSMALWPLAILMVPIYLWIMVAGIAIIFRRVRDAGGSAWIPGSMYITAVLYFATMFGAIASPDMLMVSAGVGVVHLVICLVVLVYLFLPTKAAGSAEA